MLGYYVDSSYIFVEYMLAFTSFDYNIRIIMNLTKRNKDFKE